MVPNFTSVCLWLNSESCHAERSIVYIYKKKKNNWRNTIVRHTNQLLITWLNKSVKLNFFKPIFLHSFFLFYTYCSVTLATTDSFTFLPLLRATSYRSKNKPEKNKKHTQTHIKPNQFSLVLLHIAIVLVSHIKLLQWRWENSISTH